MQKDIFNNILLDDSKLADLPVADLQLLVEQFPYFQTARILLLKKMREEESLAFDRELKNSAVYIGDRAKLYIYLNAFSGGEMMAEALPELSLITTSGEKDGSVTASFSGEEDTTFNYLFLSEEEAREVNQQEAISTVERLEAMAPQQPEKEGAGEWDLITQFMNSGNKKIKPADEAKVPQGNLAESSVQENNTVLTETLAKIYIKQKKYTQAIGIFKSLSLKNPEKSGYFAARIEELELLINNS